MWEIELQPGILVRVLNAGRLEAAKTKVDASPQRLPLRGDDPQELHADLAGGASLNGLTADHLNIIDKLLAFNHKLK